MLIHCATYENGRKLSDLAPDDIPAFLARSDLAPGAFVWVALLEPEADELSRLADYFDLHELAVEDAVKGLQRPKIDEYGENLFTFLRTVEPASEGDEHPYRVGEIAIFAGTRYILSVRKSTRTDLSPVRQRCERDPDLLRLGPAFVLYALMDAVVDRYFPVLEHLEGEIEALETMLFRRLSARQNVKTFYTLQQKLRVFKHAISPLLEAVNRLQGGRPPPLAAPLANYFRDVYDHLARLNATVDGMRETLQTMLQVNLTLVSLAENENTKKLAAWAAMIAVPTLIAGIYGMNFTNMPELHWLWGYPISILLMVIADVLLYLRFKRVRWL